MDLTPLWGALSISLLCPILGGLPLTHWFTLWLTGKDLRQTGTGNISVGVAFTNGGVGIGIFAILTEAGKGIAAVAVARWFFADQPVWEILALIALVLGHYAISKGVSTTNVVWGIIAQDPVGAVLIGFMGGICFTLFRDRQSGRLVILFLLVLILSLRHPNSPPFSFAVLLLSLLLAWIYQQLPEHLGLPENQAQKDSQTMFKFFRVDRNILSLDHLLEAEKVGQKAATLSQLKNWGYPVPRSWVLPPGDDPQPLLNLLLPTNEHPLIVRSSVIGEDLEMASAAGQYMTIGNITNQVALEEALRLCQTSYNNPSAVQYRLDRQQNDIALAVIVQEEIKGVFSGVAFSKDPVDRYSLAVAIEALPGNATRVVSGQITPAQYRVIFDDQHSPHIEGDGDIPPSLIAQVAQIALELEAHFRGVPQDLEWSYDGQQLWILQSRPISTLQPIWTRNIAAEVLPGVMAPLSWSINHPLTCYVWSDLFTLILGDRAQNFNWLDTLTLHHSRPYFNATMFREIFKQMGLPPESLELLTKRENFWQPNWTTTLKTLPGLFKLLHKEWSLVKDFERDLTKWFRPRLQQLKYPVNSLSPEELIARIEGIVSTLKRMTYYRIFAPLSLTLRQNIFQLKDRYLDHSQTPEIAATLALVEIATKTRHLIPKDPSNFSSSAALFAYLAESPDSETVLAQFEHWLATYGYLSDVTTDIAVPRWSEDPRPARERLAQYFLDEQKRLKISLDFRTSQQPGWRSQIVQQRLNLKGRVNKVYSQLLAHLRETFLELEKHWLEGEFLKNKNDLFFLKFEEIRELGEQLESWGEEIEMLIKQRRSQWEKDQQLSPVPFILYGNPHPEIAPPMDSQTHPPRTTPTQLKGIGASEGIREGKVKILRSLGELVHLDREIILVIPYLNASWAPLLARVGGIIAEVGGKLSHGAIIAREYGLPAIMDVRDATHRLPEGQRVRIDGQQGVIEIL